MSKIFALLAPTHAALASVDHRKILGANRNPEVPKNSHAPGDLPVCQRALLDMIEEEDWQAVRSIALRIVQIAQDKANTAQADEMGIVTRHARHD